MKRISLLALSTLLALGIVATSVSYATALVINCPTCDNNGGGDNGDGDGDDDDGGGDGAGNPGDDKWMQIACRVPGTRTETVSDDLRFTNTGGQTIPASMSIHWQVKQLNQSGAFSLNRPLLPGESVDAPDELRAALPTDTRCLVRLG